MCEVTSRKREDGTLFVAAGGIKPLDICESMNRVSCIDKNFADVINIDSVVGVVTTQPTKTCLDKSKNKNCAESLNKYLNLIAEIDR
jgi:hypothetical protein